MSKYTNEANNELMMLQHLKDNGRSDHPGFKHVFCMLEVFHVDGPNGRHICIVSDVVGPNAKSVAEAYRNRRTPALISRWVSRQLLLVVDYLHEIGVVHGGKISGIWCFEK